MSKQLKHKPLPKTIVVRRRNPGKGGDEWLEADLLLSDFIFDSDEVHLMGRYKLIESFEARRSVVTDKRRLHR